jgi:hypothetical protein
MKLLLLTAFLFAAMVATAEAAAAPASTRSPLEKGMAADAILQAVGKPAEVVPMKSEGAKAETWYYRRKLKQVAVTEPVMSVQSGVNWGNTNVRSDPITQYRQKYVITHQVTALLVVDGKLVLGRQWLEESQSYAN